MPVSPNSVVLTVLGDAVFRVVTGQMNSQEAAEQAINALEA